MADLFKPDPEPTEASQKKEKPPPPAWMAGCKSGLLTVLSFFFLLAMMFVTCAGFVATNHHLGLVEKKIEELQNDVKDLKSQTPDDKKVMPRAGD